MTSEQSNAAAKYKRKNDYINEETIVRDTQRVGKI